MLPHTRGTHPTPRHGRLLVECAVGALLLVVGAVALAGATRSVALLADDAILVGQAQARASALAESALAAPCGTSTPSSVAPRLVVSATAAGAAGAELLEVRAEPRLSPFAGHQVAPLELSAARECR